MQEQGKIIYIYSVIDFYGICSKIRVMVKRIEQITSNFPLPANSVPDFSDSVIYFRKSKDRNSPVFRYYQVTEQFQNQLNGYRYCWNNPVRYTDPTGNWGSAKDFYVAYCGLLGATVGFLLGLPFPADYALGQGAAILGDFYWDYCMQVEWYVSNFCVAPPDFGYYNNQ